MSTPDFDRILNQARQSLTPEEQRRLSEELLECVTARNDESRGRSVLDALEELGIVGSITNGPGDLSTNPKHMEGFGEHGQ